MFFTRKREYTGSQDEAIRKALELMFHERNEWRKRKRKEKGMSESLCKHDWVGDDACAYCRCEELDAENAELKQHSIDAAFKHVDIAKERDELQARVRELEVDHVRHLLEITKLKARVRQLEMWREGAITFYADLENMIYDSTEISKREEEPKEPQP